MANRKRSRGNSWRAAATTPAAGEAYRSPTVGLKLLLGIALLPVLCVLAQTLFTSLVRETVARALWRTEEVWFFLVGADAWALLFWVSPWLRKQLLPLYVYGHEWTHAIWAWAFGGKVKMIGRSAEGGYVVTNKDDVWVVLAPYFYPLFGMAVVLLYGLLAWWIDVAPYHRLFFLALGVSWSFHVMFTIWMIAIGQPDLVYHGRFFSLVFILIMNLLALGTLLVIASPAVSAVSFGREFAANFAALLAWAHEAGRALARHAAALR